MKTFQALALTLALTGIQHVALGAAFRNGDFEAPGVADGTQSTISAGTEPTGWVAGGNATPSEFDLFYENDVFGVLGIAGPNAVGFGGDDTSGATLSQTFDTVAGHFYTVGFYLTSQQGDGALQSMRLDAFSGDATLLASSDVNIPNIDPGTQFYEWHAESLGFTAASTSTTLIFTDTSDPALSGNANWALDGVTVSTAPVPEPSTCALLVTALGVVGWVSRRRIDTAHTHFDPRKTMQVEQPTVS